jgi:hypothetical protein
MIELEPYIFEIKSEFIIKKASKLYFAKSLLPGGLKIY